MIIENDLTPCPMCGSKPIVDHWISPSSNKEMWKVECPKCLRGTSGVISLEMITNFWENSFVPKWEKEKEAMPKKKQRKPKEKKKKDKDIDEVSESLRKTRAAFDSIVAEDESTDYVDDEEDTEAYEEPEE